MELVNENPTKLDLFATSDLIAELSRRGYDVNAIYEKNSMSKLIKTAMNEVVWDNWEEDDGTYMKLGDVYWSKLDWIKDTLDEDDEAYDTINDLQETICPILNLLDNE
jgi:hypothetical protein